MLQVTSLVADSSGLAADVQCVRVRCCKLQALWLTSAGLQQMYDFAYRWGREKGHKCLQQDTALGLWQLLFTAQPWPLSDAW